MSDYQIKIIPSIKDLEYSPFFFSEEYNRICYTLNSKDLEYLELFDYDSFEIFPSTGVGFYAKDKHNVYYIHENCKLYIIECINSDSFEVFETDEWDYARDKNNVYYGYKVIEGADVKTFIPIDAMESFGISQDKNNIYVGISVLKGGKPGDSIEKIRKLLEVQNDILKEKNSGHYFGMDNLEDLSLKIQNPIAVFDSTIPGTKMVLTELRTMVSKGYVKNLICAIKPSEEANNVISIYPCNTTQIKLYIINEQMQYCDEEKLNKYLVEDKSTIINENTFTQEEIDLIKESGFPDFDGTNINVEHEEDLGNIALSLILNIQINSTKWIGPVDDSILEKLTKLFFKIISFEELNINYYNSKGHTLLGMMIMFENTVVIKELLRIRKDFDIGYYPETGGTYKEYALSFGYEEIVKIIEKYEKELETYIINE